LRDLAGPSARGSRTERQPRSCDDIENPRRGIAPRSRGAKHARTVEIRRPRGTRRYNKRGFPRALAPPAAVPPPLPPPPHPIPLGGKTARFSLRIPIRLPFALARASTVRPSLSLSLSPRASRAPLSLATAREERVRAAVYACTDMYTRTCTRTRIQLHITRSRVLSKCFCFTYRRRLVNAV